MTAPLDVGSIEARAVTLWRDESFSRPGALVLSETQHETSTEEWRALPAAQFDTLLAAARECGELVGLLGDARKCVALVNVNGYYENYLARLDAAISHASLKAGAGGGA